MIQYYHSQQSPQFLPQVAYGLCNTLGKRQLHLMRHRIGLRIAALGSLTSRYTRRLPCYHRRALTQSAHSAVQSALQLGAAMQNVPLIALERQARMDCSPASARRRASIHNRPVAQKSVVLALPQQQRPAIAVGIKRADTGPDRAAMDIYQIEIGSVAVVGVDLVQRHGADAGGHVGCQKVQRALLSICQDGGNGRQANTTLRQDTETGLDVTVRGMGAPDGQDLTLQVARSRRRGDRRCERLYQGLLCMAPPGIQGRARDSVLTREAGDKTVVTLVCQHHGSPLRPLFGRARMCVNHTFLPDGLVGICTSTIPPGSSSVRDKSRL